MRVLRFLIVSMMALLTAPASARAQEPELPVVDITASERIGSAADVPATMRLPGFEGQVAIEVRGRWSLRYPKRAYRLELRDEPGDNRNAPLLGMPSEDDWVLYAAYDDRTLMRNVLAFDTARWMGRYAARTRYVELRLNGVYEGVYVLMEKLKLHPRRVVEQEGGFLLEWTSRVQAARKDPSFLTPLSRRPIVWEDPERKDLSTPGARRISRRVAQVERLIYTGRPGAWRRHLDADAAVDFFLLNELFKNEDGMHASTFLSGSPGRALRLGPVWDFDVAMGASDRGLSQFVSGWMLANRPWAKQLYRDRAFARAMNRRWQELRRSGIRARLLREVRTTSRELAPATRRDNARWSGAPLRIGGSTRSHVAELERWLRQRIAWLDSAFPRLAVGRVTPASAPDGARR